MPSTPEPVEAATVSYVEDGREVDISEPTCPELWEPGSEVRCGREAGHPGHHFHIEVDRFSSGAWLW